MLGLMQRQPLLVSSIITHAARHHGTAEVVSREEDGSVGRTTYAQLERRARRLATGLQALGVQPGDRVATLAKSAIAEAEAAASEVGAMPAGTHEILEQTRQGVERRVRALLGRLHEVGEEPVAENLRETVAEAPIVTINS